MPSPRRPPRPRASPRYPPQVSGSGPASFLTAAQMQRSSYDGGQEVPKSHRLTMRSTSAAGTRAASFWAHWIFPQVSTIDRHRGQASFDTRPKLAGISAGRLMVLWRCMHLYSSPERRALSRLLSMKTRRRTVNVRFSDGEWQLVSRAAKFAEQSVAQYARNLLLRVAHL